MKMRKFIITLHEDGSVQWNEYEEPAQSRKEVFREAKRLLDRMLHTMPWNGYKTHPGMSDAWYAGYSAACEDLRLENVY